MTAGKPLRGAALGRIGDLMDEMPGVHLRDLPPFTILLVRTLNTLYRVVVTQWPEVYVQGGTFFPDPTVAHVDGSSFGGSCLRVGWVSAGLRVEIRSGGRRITTSPVVAITTEEPSSRVVHQQRKGSGCLHPRDTRVGPSPS